MRQIIHWLKLRSGMKDIYQSQSVQITDRSLLLFMRMARDHLTDPLIRSTTRSIPNIECIKDFYRSGIAQFQNILTEEARKDKGNKFKLGSVLAEINRFSSSSNEPDLNHQE